MRQEGQCLHEKSLRFYMETLLYWSVNVFVWRNLRQRMSFSTDLNLFGTLKSNFWLTLKYNFFTFVDCGQWNAPSSTVPGWSFLTAASTTEMIGWIIAGWVSVAVICLSMTPDCSTQTHLDVTYYIRHTPQTSRHEFHILALVVKSKTATALCSSSKVYIVILE